MHCEKDGRKVANLLHLSVDNSGNIMHRYMALHEDNYGACDMFGDLVKTPSKW